MAGDPDPILFLSETDGFADREIGVPFAATGSPDFAHPFDDAGSELHIVFIVLIIGDWTDPMENREGRP